MNKAICFKLPQMRARSKFNFEIEVDLADAVLCKTPLKPIDQKRIRKRLYEMELTALTQLNTPNLSTTDQLEIIATVMVKFNEITLELKELLEDPTSIDLDSTKWFFKGLHLIRIAQKKVTPALTEQFRKHLDKLDNINISHPLWGGTLLHRVAVFGPIEFINLLAEKEIDFDQQDYYIGNSTLHMGNSALLWAIANSSHDVALELLKYPQNLELRGTGNSALELVISKGSRTCGSDGEQLNHSNLEIAKKLLEKGAQVNTQNSDGNTPLHLTYLRQDQEMVTLLLNHGANKDFTNNNGEIPAEMETKNHEEFITILEAITPAFVLERNSFESSN